MELDLDSPTLFHGVMLNYAQGQHYLSLSVDVKTQRGKNCGSYSSSQDFLTRFSVTVTTKHHVLNCLICDSIPEASNSAVAQNSLCIITSGQFPTKLIHAIQDVQIIFEKKLPLIFLNVKLLHYQGKWAPKSKIKVLRHINDLQQK